MAVDGSPASNKGLREALRLAKAERGRLCILHVVNDYVAVAAMGGVAPPKDLGLPVARERRAHPGAGEGARSETRRVPVVVLRE